MSALSVAVQGRTAAERIMLDTVTIRRKTGTGFNETTGQYTDTTSTVYTGKCKLQDAGRTLQGEAEAGRREVITLSSFLHLPVSVTAVQVDDVAEVTASQDPGAVGRKLRVAQLDYKTFATARRLQVEDAIG